MLRKVVEFPHPVLRKVSGKVSKDEELNSLVEDLKDTLIHHSAAGLAAPQIGILKRVISIRTPSGILSFRNPEIVWSSKEKTYLEEGCLSLPEYQKRMMRSARIKMISLEGEFKFSDFLSHVVQHEIDHLNGVLILDF